MQLLKYLKPYRVQFVLGSLAKLGEAFLELCLPLLMARIIDVGIPSGDRSYVVKTTLQLLLFALSGFGMAAICQYFASLTSQGCGTLIRNGIMEKIASLSYREIDAIGTSKLITRITSDVNHVQLSVAMFMRLFTRAPFICIGAVVMLVGIDAKLSLVFAVLVPLLGVVVFLLMRLAAPLYKKLQEKLDAYGLVIRENLGGVRVIRAFAQTRHETRRSEDAAKALSDAGVRAADVSALMNPATSIILNIGTVLILYLGAQHVFAGEIAQGDLLAMTTYAAKILYALIITGQLVVVFNRAGTSAGRITEVLSVNASVLEPENPIPVPPASAYALEFENVNFSYNGGENAVSGVSFRLEHGKTMGIIGATGCGKSTLLALAQRFYDTDSGAVKLFGSDVRNYRKSDLRGLFGCAPQNSRLFSGSIEDNVRWGGDDLSEADIQAALKTAQCADFVAALPDGLGSPVQEGGQNFSGGQRQRLAIARALAGKKRIIVLDDSLSALDYHTDLMLRRALKSDMPDSSFIIVSQRVSSVASADVILVLSDGQCAGIGTHDQLMQSCEAYAEIYRSQTDSDKEAV